MISQNELEHLRSIKRRTATNSFVFTTTDEQVALSFISEEDLQSTSNVTVIILHAIEYKQK